jgi:hypothetical protein
VCEKGGSAVRALDTGRASHYAAMNSPPVVTTTAPRMRVLGANQKV